MMVLSEINYNQNIIMKGFDKEFNHDNRMA